MIYKKTNPIMRKYYLQKKAEAKKGNQAIANKIQIFANAEINKVVENKAGKLAYHEGKAYNNPNTLTELININKPKIDKEYSKLINSPKTSDTFHHQIQVQNRANDQAKKISQAQYEQIQKNIKAVEQVIDKYGIKLEKYRELNEKYPKTISRKGIITESIENKNYITSLGKNIVPHLDGYRELSPLTEHLHRQAQNQASEELARAENEEAIANGQDPPNDEKKWIWTGAGATTRHQSNDGQVVPIDEPFIIVNDVTGEVDEMMYPLDPAVYSSNTFICYCEVEYGHFSENKFELTTDMIQAFDNAIKNLTIEADTHPMKVDVENNYFADEVETWAYMSDKIQDKDIKLATELLSEYSKVTNLEALPVEETFQVLQDHYKLQTVNELGTMTKKFNDTPLNEKNSFTKLSDALELVKKQAETLQIVEPVQVSDNIKQALEVLKEDEKYIKENSSNTIDLTVAMEESAKEFKRNISDKNLTKEDLEELNKQVEKIIKECEKQETKLKNNNDEYYNDYADDVLVAKIDLKNTVEFLEYKLKQEEQSKQTITETTEAIDTLVEDYDAMELQLLHEEALQEAQKAEENLQTLNENTTTQTDKTKAITTNLEEMVKYIDESGDIFEVIDNMIDITEIFEQDIRGKTFTEKEAKSLEKSINDVLSHYDAKAKDLLNGDDSFGNSIDEVFKDKKTKMQNALNDLLNKQVETLGEQSSATLRPQVESLANEMNNYIKEVENEQLLIGSLERRVEKFEETLRDLNYSDRNLTDAEINRLSKESNDLKRAIENNLQEYDYEYAERQVRVLKDRIPDERIIRKCKDLLQGENIDLKYSQNIAQGKATVSYLKRFEPVKPSQKIIDKFNNKKAFTQAEIQHLAENVGELRYLMELCDQAVIQKGYSSRDYRPVGYTTDAEALYGREPLDPKFDDYTRSIRSWTGGCDGEINKCRDVIDQYGIEEAKNQYDESFVEQALQIKELGETIVPQAYISYRGNGSSPHILENLVGDSIGETEYRNGMRFTFGRDTCTSITEWGGRDFSGLQSNGVVQNVMITVLHPPKTRGNYVDNQSVFEEETEIIIPRESEMQLLLYDEATDTYLAWECYD